MSDIGEHRTARIEELAKKVRIRRYLSTYDSQWVIQQLCEAWGVDCPPLSMQDKRIGDIELYEEGRQAAKDGKESNPPSRLNAEEQKIWLRGYLNEAGEL